jgi:hypothetical protein
LKDGYPAQSSNHSYKNFTVSFKKRKSFQITSHSMYQVSGSLFSKMKKQKKLSCETPDGVSEGGIGFKL